MEQLAEGKLDYAGEIAAMKAIVEKLTHNDSGGYTIRGKRATVSVHWRTTKSPDGEVLSPLAWNYWVVIGENTTLCLSMANLVPSAGDDGWIELIPSWIDPAIANKNYIECMTKRLQSVNVKDGQLANEIRAIDAIVNHELAKNSSRHRLANLANGDFIDISWKQATKLTNRRFRVHMKKIITRTMCVLSLLPSNHYCTSWIGKIKDICTHDTDRPGAYDAYRLAFEKRIALLGQAEPTA